MTLQTRVFLLVLVSVLPGLLLLVSNELELRSVREREYRDLILHQTRLLASDLDRITDGAHQILASVAELPQVARGDEDCAPTLRQLVQRFPQYLLIGVVRTTGIAYCSSNDAVGEDFRDRTWFKLVTEQQNFVIGEYLVGRTSARPSIHLAYPIRSDGGQVTGFVVAALDIHWLGEHFARRPTIPHSTVTIADRTGTIVVRFPDPTARVGEKLPANSLRGRITEVRTTEMTGFDGGTKVVGFVPLEQTAAQAFDVALGVDKAALVGEIDRLFGVGVAIIAAGLAAALGAAGLTGRYFVRRPVERLLQGINRWSAGDRSPFIADDSGGELGQVSRAFRGLTDALRAREEELITAKERAEAGSKAKSEFLAIMSHELRTPMNAILGFSEIIRDARFGPLAQRYRDYAGDIHGSGEHLLALIDDMLDLSKIEAGRLELQDDQVDLNDVVQSSIHTVEGEADASGIVLASRLPREAHLIGDRVRLKQATLNLLTNAVRSTPAGGRVEIELALSGAGKVQLSVSDSGPGMSKEEIQIAIEPFRQVNSLISRDRKGTGLGLPLVGRFAELHGARLEIDSREGQGTTAAIIFPEQRTLSFVPADNLSSRSTAGV